MDWIQKVQSGIARKEITNVNSLRSNSKVEYTKYQQILECREEGLSIQENGEFNCTIYLKQSFLGEEKLIRFSDKTTAREFKI